MSASIRTQAPPNMEVFPKINVFNREDFNEALWENGYEVTLEEAVACPCKGLSSAPKVTCGNCLGTGWVFVNPIKTKAFASSINKNTKYKDWSPEMIGTVAVTFMNVNRFGFMDKITLNKNFGFMSESFNARINTDPGYAYFVFGTYKFVEITSVFVFGGDNLPLIKLDATEYRINPNNGYVLDIKETSIPEGFNMKISVSYKHRITYNILDIPHDIRITKHYDQSGKREMQEMPIHAIARKAQYELGSASNYSGNNIFDNSFK